MIRSISTLAGIAAVAFAASAGTAAAECFGAHSQVTASVSEPQDGTSMSTFDGQLPTVEEQTTDEAQATEAPETTADDGQDRK